MNSRDRVLAALNVEEPDTLPIHDGYSKSFLQDILGVVVDDLLWESWSIVDFPRKKRGEILNRLCDLHVALNRKLGFDSMFLNARVPLVGWEERTLEEGIKVSAWGIRYRYDKATGINWYVGGALTNVEYAEKWANTVDFGEGYTEAAKILMKKAKHLNVAMIGVMDGLAAPFLSRGFSHFTVDLFRRPNLAEKMLDIAMKHNIEIAKLYVELGVDAVQIGGDDAFDDGPLFSPNLWRRFFFPRLRKIVQFLKKHGIPVIKHTDGNTMTILKNLVETGINAYDSIQPTAGMDIGEVKRLYGDRICLCGNVDNSNTLVNRPVESVVEEVKACIRAASPGGGHILASDNGLHVGIRPSNVMAMLRTGRKYGKYK